MPKIFHITYKTPPNLDSFTLACSVPEDDILFALKAAKNLLPSQSSIIAIYEYDEFNKYLKNIENEKFNLNTK